MFRLVELDKCSLLYSSLLEVTFSSKMIETFQKHMIKERHADNDLYIINLLLFHKIGTLFNMSRRLLRILVSQPTNHIFSGSYPLEQIKYYWICKLKIPISLDKSYILVVASIFEFMATAIVTVSGSVAYNITQFQELRRNRDHDLKHWL